MVVCKFFQQGYCRYGQNCRFEHIYGTKYSYHAPQNTQPPPPAATSPAGVTDEQLVKQVQSDVQSVLKGNQWILSSYAPFKEKPALPGISDLSPEEARLFIYEAKANNSLDQAVGYMNNLFKETRGKYEQLLQPPPSTINVLRRLYNGETVSSPFDNVNTGQTGFGSSSSAASVFRSATQNTSVFGQPQQSKTAASIFGQKENSGFGSSNPDPAKSIFSQATQSVFGSPTQNFGSPTQNTFGNTENVAANSIFALANQNSFASQPVQAIPSNPTSVFASAAQQHFGQPTDVFKQASPIPPLQPANVFQQSQHANNIFGVATPSEDDSGVYSNQEELSPEDMEAYSSDSFTLGFIPELPPPQTLCI